jgi:hypothetical protein
MMETKLSLKEDCQNSLIITLGLLLFDKKNVTSYMNEDVSREIVDN